MNQEEVNRKLSCILSTDVVGYSRLMEENEVSTVRCLEENKRQISRLVAEYQGRVVDSPGDNLLAEFSSAVNAVDCAVKIQKVLKIKNADLVENKRMQFRIGINLGDVIEEGGRLYGSGVNIAARLEGLADPGGICISKKVYDEIKTKLDLGYEYLGEHEVKNITEPVQVYRVQTGIVAEKVNKKVNIGISSMRNIGTFLVIIIAGLFVWRFYPSGRIKVDPASFEAERPAVPEVKEAPKTIAVLPFENISPDPDQEYFVDGLSEEILNSLTQIPGLGVTARTSSFAFKGTDKTVPDIARVLGVNHILEGSVRKSGDTLRITAQLIRSSDGLHLWSVTYDRELKDIFKIQEDIATAVADELKITLGVGLSLKSLGGTKDIEAYELYLKALGKLKDEQSISSWKSALQNINEAVGQDPEFAIAWARKANLHELLTLFGPANSSLDEANAALDAAQKSIELEPNLAYGHMMLGAIYQIRGEWRKAEINYGKGIELRDQSLSGDDELLIPFCLKVGKFKKAIGFLENMRRNDPIDQQFLAWYYLTYGLFGDRQRAEDEYKNRNELMPKGYSDLHDEWITSARLGSGDLLSIDEIVSSDSTYIALKEYLDSPKEGLVKLRQIYDNEDNLSSGDFTDIALWAAYFGDPEFALDALEKGTSISIDILYCWFPVFHEARQLPRFKKFVREIGLVDYWKEYGWPDLCRPTGNDDFECE